MAQSMYSMRLAADRRISAGARFHAEQEEQTNLRGKLSRRIGPAFADAAVDAALDSLDKPGYPAGWGTSPRPAPTAASYKPAHGGYPDAKQVR